MDVKALTDAVANGRVEWLKHSVERMFERDIKRASVIEVLVSGEVIEEYPDDKPYPSALFLGWVQGGSLHALAAYDAQCGYCFVITVYKPDAEHFEPDCKTRRRHG